MEQLVINSYNNFLNLTINKLNSIIKNYDLYNNDELIKISFYLKRFNRKLFNITRYENIDYLLNDYNNLKNLSYKEILKFCIDNKIIYIKYNKKKFLLDKKNIISWLKKNNLFFSNNYCLIKVKDIFYLCVISIENKLEIINANTDIFKIFPYLRDDLYQIKDKFIFSLGSNRPEIHGILKGSEVIFTKGYYEI